MARGRRGDRQSYDRLRAHHRQLGVPWTDNSFPANDSSIGLQKVSSERSDLRSCHHTLRVITPGRVSGSRGWGRDHVAEGD